MKINYPETILHKSKGTTPSEEYLSKLCDDTFLSLWSFPNIYREQGRTKNNQGEYFGDGKEVCDLLVVFENHVFIFSDKYCKFPDSGDVKKNWCRWYKRTVDNSAKQIYGAERWIFDVQGKIYIDSKCTQPFPYSIPKKEDAIIHRIIVAHGSKRASIEHYKGGMGSLVINSNIEGKLHTDCSNPKWLPFQIGKVNPEKGYVHVFDDVTLEIVMKTLDTITDFTDYIDCKEKFIENGKKLLVPGEEDLLAFFLKNFDKNEKHSFIPNGESELTDLVIEEGMWIDFENSKSRKQQIIENEISYSWDEIIQKFGDEIFKGKTRFMSDANLNENEKALRILAKENRLMRRFLAKSLYDMIEKTPKYGRLIRTIVSTEDNKRIYVFLVLGKPLEIQYEQYREARQNLLSAHVNIAKLDFPNALDIVGFATETLYTDDRSEDFIYLDARKWDKEARKQAEEQRNILKPMRERASRSIYKGSVKEYPNLGEKFGTKLKGRDRNKPCPCGSEKKFKNCCGKNEQHI